MRKYADKILRHLHFVVKSKIRKLYVNTANHSSRSTHTFPLILSGQDKYKEASRNWNHAAVISNGAHKTEQWKLLTSRYLLLLTLLCFTDEESHLA
jgi:hypothetical protein